MIPRTSAELSFIRHFVDPEAPSDAEERQSCEHRVGVLILRDDSIAQG